MHTHLALSEAQSRAAPRRAAPRIHARVRTLALAVASALFALSGTTAHALPFVATPQAQPLASATGFKHPALGFTREQLDYTREQIRADVEPYKSYYQTLRGTGYANINLLPQNRDASKVDTPNTPNYNSGTAQTRMIQDSQGALTQAILYYITGQNEYRRNAMRIIRTWSNMNADGYKYFADAHIHNGVPLWRLLTAAEILRYTPADAGYAAYPLAWTEADTAKLTSNLIEPMERTFFASNERFMNQHNYSLIGRLAGAIFTDNRARYDETVEWITVNASSTRQDINGAILPLIPRIEAGDPRNQYGVEFYQIQEMWRDQAHGGDNIDLIAGLLRMLAAQGTRVDPHSGKPSAGADAVSPYRFAGNRLLMGADAFSRYMLGYQTPWADTTGGSSTISPAYRGRLFEVDAIPELYNVYKYDLGLDVDTLAPYLTTAAAHANGPAVAWGNASPANKDPGPLALFTLPRALSGVPLPANSGMLETERKSIFLNGDWSLRSEGGRTYGQAQLAAGGATVVFHDVQYADRAKYAPVGLMVRTSASLTLKASAEAGAAPWSDYKVPDTGGQWRYIVPDSANAAIAGRAVGDNIIYFKFEGAPGATIDVDFVNMAAPTQLTPPRFAMPAFPLTEIVVRGVPYKAAYTAVDANAADTLVYQAVSLPAGAVLDSSSGTMTWTPNGQQAGMHDIVISATDGVVVNTMTARLDVQPDRASAFQAAQAKWDRNAVYTSASMAAFLTEMAPLQQSALSVPDADYPALLKAVQAAVAKLQLLNPRVASDGSLDWSRSMVTLTTMGADRPALLVDDNYNSYSGDLRAPVTIDFGENYRVAANAFGIQARFNFANRSQGINVYGSHDKTQWTLLTSRETTDTSSRNYEMEVIPVVAELANERYRYFMVRVDHPGAPTDPAYPGISSYGELRFHGTRHDLLVPVDASGAVSIARSGLTLNRFTLKYSGSVTITNGSGATVSGPLQLRLDGLPAGVVLDNRSGERDGSPYITLPSLDLAPGQSVTVATTFSNPSKSSISYTSKLISAKY